MPALILAATPSFEAAAATGLNTLARAIGTTLASATATGLLEAFTVTIGAATYPSQTGFRALFALGALAAVVAAVVTAFVADETPDTALAVQPSV
jgi:hypothetical protein